MNDLSRRDASLRLRPWASLLLFLSAYAPLMAILILKDIDPASPWWVRSPVYCTILLLLGVVSCVTTLATVRGLSGGLPVVVTKAANRSGDMFSYTIPYLLSFVRIDPHDWQTVAGLCIFMGMLFVMAYRTQTVFINPVLAMAGYMLVDCTFRRDDKERQALVITRAPIGMGETHHVTQLSYYLYIATPVAAPNGDGHAPS